MNGGQWGVVTWTPGDPKHRLLMWVVISRCLSRQCHIYLCSIVYISARPSTPALNNLPAYTPPCSPQRAWPRPPLLWSGGRPAWPFPKQVHAANCWRIPPITLRDSLLQAVTRERMNAGSTWESPADEAGSGTRVCMRRMPDITSL